MQNMQENKILYTVAVKIIHPPVVHRFVFFAFGEM
jgi:hypothetical protein